VLTEQALIQPQDIRLHEAVSPKRNASFHELKAIAIEQFERNYLRQALAAHDGNITKAAQSAHKARRAFWELLRKHRIIVRSSSSNSP
jgi:DNA-binding NtrC family response regulator